MKKPTVYLADLRHNHLGVLGTDTMPLSVGYMKAVMDRDLPQVSSRIFAYPEQLVSAISDALPAVLMLSNYMWNEQLSLHVARRVKQLQPETLVVMGGPNIYDDAERQCKFVEQHPEVDLYILGEGDFLATEVVEMFLDAGASIDKLTTLEIPSSIYKRPDGSVVRHEVRKRERALDDIPSPWLTGIMDEFFDGRLGPLWETNRGCPFKCSFCVQGTRYYTRVTNFSADRLREELHYMGRMIRDHSPGMGMLRIADPNWGMYARDPILSESIAEVQTKYRWPTYIDATTGKNRPDRVIQSLEKVGGALVFWQAVQSLDEEVLVNINRQNIKLEAYDALQVHMRGRGLKSSADLILGLPGETLDGHLAGILRMIDSGSMKLNNYQCMMLKGTEMECPETRSQFGLVTKYRSIGKSFGVYDGEAVIEHDEIVVTSSALPFDDYLRARTYHFGCAVFMNHSRFESLLEFANRVGSKRSALYLALVQAMQDDGGEVRDLLDKFLAETQAELFDSPQAMRQHYAKEGNFERLNCGEIGDNLIAKFLGDVCLRVWEPVCRLALTAAHELLGKRLETRAIVDFERIWCDFETYLLNKYATGTNKESLVEPVSVTLNYQVEEWIADDFPADTARYRLDAPTCATFEFNSARLHEISAAIDRWSLSPQGGSMLLKRMRVGGLARDVILAESQA